MRIVSMLRGHLNTRAYIGVVVFLALPRPAAAQVTVTSQDGTVSVRASQATLASVIRALEPVVKFEALRLDPGAEQLPVSVAFDELNIRSALRAILDAADVNYVLVADRDGKSIRLAASRNVYAGPSDLRRADDSIDRASVARVDHGDTSGNSVRAVAEPHESNGSFGSRGHIGGGATTGRGGSFTAAAQAQSLEYAVTQRAVPAAPGTVVQLPFPDALGAPLVSVVPPKNPNANPLPLPGVTPPAQSQPQPTAAAPNANNSDPHVQQLIDALSPKPRR